MKNHARHLISWAVVIWTFVITTCRAIRWPNDFSEAHWLLDYRFGFIKRGFIGSICSFVTNLLSLQMNPRLIATLSVITFCSMSATMLYILFRAYRQKHLRNSILVLGIVFASSPFVVMNAHVLGYFDALLYFLAIVSVGLVLCDRPFLAALVSVASILTHESYLLIGFPLVCFASVAVLTASNKRVRWRPHLIAICITLAAFLAISALQILTTDAMTLRSQLTEHLDSSGFVPKTSKRVAVWQTTTFLEFFRKQNRHFYERLLNPAVWASVGPTVLVLLIFIHSWFKIRAFSPFSIMLLGVVCAPLAIHAVAWDTARISTYSIGSAFIALWILVETRATRGANGLFLLITLPVLILNIFGSIPLMGGRVERFSVMSRLLMYSPAIAVFLTTVFRNMTSSCLREIRDDRIPNKAIDADEE